MRTPLMYFNNRQVACAKPVPSTQKVPRSLHAPNFPHLTFMTKNMLITQHSGNISRLWKHFDLTIFALPSISGGSFAVMRANINNYFP
ncbi:hypothetical protein GDO81_017222 [Engystomops pustulosus]|uniref:Uncharacterized protein n=1 Tax=Engystomops pustulosus TaxID=76066 RepID=A0AAV7AFZ8_ENGPU|nr:hypothetical protein GDO81_017222 [Engystomops pustulosus]